MGPILTRYHWPDRCNPGILQLEKLAMGTGDIFRWMMILNPQGWWSFVCVCACACVRVRVCMCACVRACVWRCYGKWFRDAKEGTNEMFYFTMHTQHILFMVIWRWTYGHKIVREETRCHHMGYSFQLTARVLLYAPSHRQDSTYHNLCYTSLEHWLERERALWVLEMHVSLNMIIGEECRWCYEVQ